MILVTASEAEMFIITVHVDNTVLAANSDKQALTEQFEVKYMEDLHYLLGVKVVQNKNGVWIVQEANAAGTLQRFSMKGVKAVKTPVNTGTKLVKAMGEDKCVDQQLYQSAKSK